MTANLEEQIDRLQNGKVNNKKAFLSFLDAMKSWIEGFLICEWNDTTFLKRGLL